MSLILLFKSLLSSKFVLYGAAIILTFMAGYCYRGLTEELRQAKIEVREVIKYVEREQTVRKRYNKIDTSKKSTKGSILSGRVSEHYTD